MPVWAAWLVGVTSFIGYFVLAAVATGLCARYDEHCDQAEPEHVIVGVTWPVTGLCFLIYAIALGFGKLITGPVIAFKGPAARRRELERHRVPPVIRGEVVPWYEDSTRYRGRRWDE